MPENETPDNMFTDDKIKSVRLLKSKAKTVYE